MRTRTLLFVSSLLSLTDACVVDLDVSEGETTSPELDDATIAPSGETEPADQATTDEDPEDLSGGSSGPDLDPADTEEPFGEYVQEIYFHPEGMVVVAEPSEEMAEVLGESVDTVWLDVNEDGTEYVLNLAAGELEIASYAISAGTIYAWEKAEVQASGRLAILDPNTGTETEVAIELGEIDHSIGVVGRIGAKAFSWRTRDRVHPSRLGLELDDVRELTEAQAALLIVQPIVREAVELAEAEKFEGIVKFAEPFAAFEWDARAADEVEEGVFVTTVEASTALESLSGAARIEQRRGTGADWIEVTTLGYAASEELLFVSSTFSDRRMGTALTSQWFASGSNSAAGVAGASDFNADGFALGGGVSALSEEVAYVLHPGSRQAVQACASAGEGTHDKCSEMGLKVHDCKDAYPHFPSEWCDSAVKVMCPLAATEVMCACTGAQAQCVDGPIDG